MFSRMAPRHSTLKSQPEGPSPLKKATSAAKAVAKAKAQAAAQAAAKAAKAKAAEVAPPAEELPEQGNGEDAPEESPGQGSAVKEEMVSPAKPPKASRGNLPSIPKDEAKKMNYKVKALAAKGDTQLLEKLQSCKSQMEKRDFFYNIYMLDPKVSEKKVKKRDVEEDIERVTEKEGWWTAEVIAEWKGIKPGCSNYEAKVQAAVEGLPERKHKDKALAKLGVMEYEYTHIDQDRQVKKAKLLELDEEVADVGQEDFNSMRAALHKGSGQKMISNKASGSQPNKPKAGLNKAQEVDVEVEVDWVQNYKDQYKKCKGLLSSVAAEIHSLEVQKGKVAAMPDTEEMKGPLERQLGALSTELQQKKRDFLQKQLNLPKEVPKDQAEAKSKDLNSFCESMQEYMKQFRKEFAKHKKFVEN